MRSFQKMRVSDHFSVSRIRDDYNTPVEAWKLLLDNMSSSRGKRTFWLPFYNDGTIKRQLKPLDVDVIHVKKDFFKFEPKQYDAIVDNPPYSQKREIFERCKQLKKPFALLVPMETIERKYFSDLFKNDKSLQVIIPKKRYEFKSTYAGCQNKIPFKSVSVSYTHLTLPTTPYV